MRQTLEVANNLSDRKQNAKLACLFNLLSETFWKTGSSNWTIVPHKPPWDGVAKHLSEGSAHQLCLAFFLCRKVPEDAADQVLRKIEQADASMLMCAYPLLLVGHP